MTPANAPAQRRAPRRNASDRLASAPNQLPSLESAPLEVLARVPEEQLWLANFTSANTKSTYRQSVVDFIKALKLNGPEDFKQVSRAAVIAWRDKLAAEGRSPRTVKTRLSALSSLFRHLEKHDVVLKNVVSEVDPPRLRVLRGETKALSPVQARRLLDAPPETTLQGLRDRAILAVGLQVGPRRDEIAKLRVKDFHDEKGFPCLKLRRKGGAHGSVAIHQQVEQRIRAYLDRAGHANEKDSPLFRAVRTNQITDEPDRQLTPRQIDRIFKRWCRKVHLPPGYSSHSMRATCATRALENGASLEQVQELLGHAKPSTTQLYDRRGYNPERSASFFVTY